MCLYQLKKGQSQNPTVAVHINGIPISPNLDTQADVMVVIQKHYGKLQASFFLQRTGVTIRNSGEEKGWSLCLLKEHLQQHSLEERERWQNLCMELKVKVTLGFVEYYLDLTSSNPLSVMGKSRQAKVDLVEEYKDATTHESRQKGHCAGTEEYLYS